MHFSKVKDGPTLDLELLFSGAITLRWADEFTGSVFHPMSVPAPKCRNERWSKWVFPLLIIQESSWLVTYQYPGNPRHTKPAALRTYLHERPLRHRGDAQRGGTMVTPTHSIA